MARNPVREQLLAEVKARRRAAGQKVSRLERNGVRVRKEGLDPRLSNTQLEGMNARQLRSHLEKLNSFTSRSTGFVAGHNGVPLSARMWRDYQRAEKLHNERSAAFYERVRSLNIPGLGQNVEERLAELRQKTRSGDYRSFGIFERTAAGITGQDALKDLLTQMRKRTDPRYLEREARLQRRIINKMLARTSNKDLIVKMRDMSDEEVITLAQYTDFMTVLESSYAMAKSTSSDTPRWQSSVYEDNEDKIHEWAEWAHRHFSDRQDPDEENHDTAGTGKPRGSKRVPFTPGTGDFNPVIDGATGVRTPPARDRFGRFVGSESRPDPTFARDERGRFKPGGGKFNPRIK